MLLSLHILQANESTVSLPTISMSRAKMHINMLASDEMRGRNTPSPELEKAASYIADQFKQLGVLPINGSYYHTYTLERLHLDKPTTFIVKKGNGISEMALKDDFIPFEYSGSSIVEYAQLAFAGYGITAPEYKYDDYKDLDVKGKVVIILRGEPQMDNDSSVFEGKRFTKYSRMQSKLKTAVAKGAVGVIVLSGPSNALK
ncbi:MAG: PA domain-containing protein, partial [Ignavibacteria bacterium]